MTPEQRRQYAEQIRANPLVPEILSMCRQASFQRWETAPDVQTRELCWLQWQAYNGFESQLTATVAAILKELDGSVDYAGT